ncbi:DEAD/DEAH box helicase [Candidatus Poribacteria bacterium]|nr:DEAD/DEAH box helicase [Candidatus Poribacteria bacterium]MYB66249.1 DEAD/DEAH box helicase [Candidatus Poribacteria bacterium]MYI94264.1 DEAD/DEAH box helicase [Candidatus Poribacteria bacterium]
MADAIQIPLFITNEESDNGFYDALNYIRQNVNTQFGKGRLFERLIRAYLLEDPFYRKRFSEVYLWGEWAENQPGFDRVDRGIDLVAIERNNGICAIQCKCYAEDKRISKSDIDTFISESNRQPFTARIFVDTGKSWTTNLKKAIDGLEPPCQRISAADLASRPVQWPNLSSQEPDQLNYQLETFSLRDHQKEAFDDVINGFKDSDRGKLIMACGTGKTFTALRIAEDIAGIGGRVLYLVPSIGLFAQAMREWAEQQAIPHRYIGICSDTKAGKANEDVTLMELEFPVTTDEIVISEALQRSNSTDDEDSMRVVFCTYQSLPKVAEAQEAGAPEFDLILCDEGHRTTGIDKPDDKTSPFVLVHDTERIRAKKRLYMTATPRLYTQGAKTKAAKHDIDVFSMDDPNTYGPEFHRLPFSKAVTQELLSDYKVVVLAMSEQRVQGTLHNYLSNGGSEVNISDAAKIVGCWRALQNPERKSPDDDTIKPLTRAIAFTNTIRSSQNLEKHWNGIIESAIEETPEESRPANFKCETAHVDGTKNALDRKRLIEWLKGDTDDVCRILSNARCLSEGIDVPALDAVLFMSPRNSHVDIVQAVGRVMRKAPDKEYGYIVLPVAIPPGVDPVDALNDNERFATVWGVLRALRSHDDRLNAEINKIDLNNEPTEIIIFEDENGDGEYGEGTVDPDQLLLPFGIPADAIYAKIVEKCGDRKYWESWAKDVADIFKRLVGRIENLLENPENSALQEWFDDFHNELMGTINDSITRESAIDMMAQHIITRPVFEALFDNYDFASGNPVANALNKLQNDFSEFGLENETRDLEGFYESVRMRAQGLDNSEARQRVLLELYEKFFVTALKKEVERLGIVYTPIEVVDFILHSANEVLQDEFGRSLSDEGVHVLDPFTGTGIFLTRLLQSNIIQDADLERKYREELHANEIVLLAYYIATVNIEETFRGRRGEDSTYEPFNGIVLTDTFNLNKKDVTTLFPKEWLPDNNKRAERQQKLPIQVIVGNPPWSMGQRSAADNNQNVPYPELEERIKGTYAEYSQGNNKNSLYDTYKMAIRWASDRIGEKGIIAFVTSGSWIDGNTDSGVRACLAEEFSSIHVLHLRGNQRTQGDRSRQEGGKIFGSGSRAPVAISILVKNPNATYKGCKIQYRDIGDYLTREEKLEALHEAESITGFSDWNTITPDTHYDWIGQRSEAFSQFYPLGTKDAKSRKKDDAIFGLYSRGYGTGRDVYIYNFSYDVCAENAKRMTQDYLNAIAELDENPELTVDEVTLLHNSHIKWGADLKKKLERKKLVEFKEDYIRKVMYRPFIGINCYADYAFAQENMGQIFFDISDENRVICVPGKSWKNQYSVLMTDTMPDLNFNEAGAQCFPRWQYPKSSDKQDASETLLDVDDSPDRIDNISDTALKAFQEHYSDDTITKDDIFYYVYGILHAPSYREQFANDLSKMLPRIPYAPDFTAFAEAGYKLAELHLNYETCEQHPLSVEYPNMKSPPTDIEHADPNLFLLTERSMKFIDDQKRIFAINDNVRITNIPKDSSGYVVNGRTPLEWFIDRYYIKTDKDSGIVNDPNGWFADPRDLVTAIKRIVYVSVESARIIDGLPAEITSD